MRVETVIYQSRLMDWSVQRVLQTSYTKAYNYDAFLN